MNRSFTRINQNHSEMSILEKNELLIKILVQMVHSPEFTFCLFSALSDCYRSNVYNIESMFEIILDFS